MGYLTTSAGIVGELSAVEGIGRVHAGDRHIRDDKRLHDLLGVEAERDVSDRMPVRGWFVTRESLTEEPFTQSRTKSTERWMLRGVQSVTAGDGSEASWQALLDRVWAHFRGVTSVGDLECLEAASTPAIGFTTIGDRLCHLAEIELEATEEHTINATLVPADPVLTATATTRESYSDAACQIAALLADVPDAGRVHAERLWAHSAADKLDLFSLPPVGDEGLLEGRRELRSWQVYRGAATEARGIGNRIEATATYAVQGSRSWRDSAGSYCAFQAHLDAVRARVRAVQTLGNVANPTQAESSPLQVTEVGARQVGPYLTHFADCEVQVAEVVHAATLTPAGAMGDFSSAFDGAFS